TAPSGGGAWMMDWPTGPAQGDAGNSSDCLPPGSAYPGFMRIRYSRWDGTQDPLGPDLSAADLLEAISDDLLSGQGAEGGLSRLMRRGMHGRFTGLDSLRARLREARRR